MTSLPSPSAQRELSTGELVDDDLAAALGAELTAQWRMTRGPQPTAVWVERSAGIPVAAVLTTRRPATLATKIAFVWQAEGEAGVDAPLHRLVDAVVSDAQARGDIAVKWQRTEEIASPEAGSRP